MVRRSVLSSALLVISASCAVPSAERCASNCSGCCDINDKCQGASANSCGANGSACTQCVGNQICSLGLCYSANASGGGGGGATGGGAGGGGGSGGGGSGGTDAGTDGGTGDGGSTTCERLQATKLGSNLYIAFDKSGSMVDPILAGGPSKWAIATTAVKQMATQYEAQLQLGLGLFPVNSTTNGRCLVGPASVGVGDRRAAAIASALDGETPGGSTPIGAVLLSAGAVPELVDPLRANYVLLVTDGTETCNGNGVQVTTDNLAMKGIKTFVIGFGGAVDATNLTDLAVAGGTPLPGTPRYYQANDASGLLTALQQIARGALGCEYQLASAPADESRLFVYVNGVLQNRDVTHAGGWDYSAATRRVSFSGGLCNLVATDATTRVSVVTGCRDDGLADGRDGGAGLPAGAACRGSADCTSGVCASGTCG